MSGNSIFFPIPFQRRPSDPNETRPTPTIAPVNAWVVETGIPLHTATSTHRTAPESTAAAIMGDEGVAGARSPSLKVFTIAVAISPESPAPTVVQNVPHRIALL